MLDEKSETAHVRTCRRLAATRVRIRRCRDSWLRCTPGSEGLAREKTILMGHPNAELLKRLETARVRIQRTDRDGAVHILTDGNQLEVNCFVACPDTFRSTAPAQT
jgi:hypothetical protein